MRFQDETTTPREPSLAQKRAREQADRREREARIADEAARKKRKRLLIGGGATVGVVALIAMSYAAADSDEGVEARCVDANNVVVDESNCATPAASSGNYYGGGGFFPIFIGGGGRQYHYNYGGNGQIGQPVRGGTTAVPRSSTRVTTPSGRTLSGGSSGFRGSDSVSRGGLGVSGSGSSSGS